MRLPLALIIALAAGPAFAAEAVAPDAPLANAQAAPPVSVADQIDHYLRTSPAAGLDREELADAADQQDRRLHGELAIGVGTRGYRSVYLRTEMPLGDRGHLTLAIGDTRFGGRYGGWASDGDFGAPLRTRERQRCGLEARTPARPLDGISGAESRCRGGPAPR